jgi:hypothetical protein
MRPESKRPVPPETGLSRRTFLDYFLTSRRTYIDGSVPGPNGRTRIVRAGPAFMPVLGMDRLYRYFELCSLMTILVSAPETDVVTRFSPMFQYLHWPRSRP